MYQMDKTTKSIKHLVVGGGGPVGFTMLGALMELRRQKFWDIKNIRTAYGCSIGALLICLMVAAKDDLDGLISYVVQRPWAKLAPSGPDLITCLIDQKGALSESFFQEALRPYLSMWGLESDIDMKTWHEHFGVGLRFLSQDLNKPGAEPCVISEETFPHIPVYRAIAMSAAFPLLAAPIFIDGGCYIDGGVKGNFPLELCLQKEGCKPTEVLAARSASWNSTPLPDLTEDSSLIDIGCRLMLRLSEAAHSPKTDIGHELTIQCGAVDLRAASTWMEALGSESKRSALIAEGKVQAHLFLAYRATKTQEQA